MKNLKLKLSRFIIKLFGNVQFFTGPLFCLLWGDTHYKVKGAEAREIINNLKAGDIMLYRFDRYFSTWFIPGFWTHVAIYAGKEKIIHATTHGVIEDDILTFLRTDYVNVLRPNVSNRHSRDAVKRAREMLGKEYDFLFDTTDDERMYCSEVVKNSYPELFKEMKGGAIPPDEFRNIGMEEIHNSVTWRKDKEKDNG